MSAVAAIVRSDGVALERAVVEGMISTMARRAPDGVRSWSCVAAGLAHGALNATRESAAESLPLVSSCGRFAITADARLDNRDELLRELALGSEAGDSELILAAYERWGQRCPERLLGDFAFAIWDARGERLFCAQDRFGVKPLYWHRSEVLAAVATEIKALLALPEVPRQLNETRFADFLALQLEDQVSTVYGGINRLPPSHSLTCDRNGVSLRRYWALDPTRALDGLPDAEYEERFRFVFLEAVRARLRSSGLVAAMLSGGMDSSSIVVAARELLEARPLHTLSALFEAVPGTDEREYIAAVLALDGLESHYVRPEQLEPLADWDGAAWRGDEPESNPQVSIARALYTGAAEAGVRCLLDGFGGDFVVSFGVERLTQLAARGRWLALVREARALERRTESLTTLRLLRTFAISPFLPSSLVAARRSVRERRIGMPGWAFGVPLRAEFADHARLHERYVDLNRGREREPRDPRRAQCNTISSGFVPVGLGVMDRIAAGFAIEPRYPFLDSRLVELCLAIPPDQKLRDGYTRDILRRALNDLLPHKIRWRAGKAIPGAYIQSSLPATGRHVMDEIILGDPGAIASYVDMARVRELYERCLQGADANTWYPVYRVVIGALWLGHARERFGLELTA